ncbi:ParB/RepB/Spo0J family plasmid partition protein [Pectobacterium aroidearum]|uniref:ParB/RepB/Spo0J family plasmid partition protein n=1 Tax=Pectobacterium aroidearum TaxID=1201031 RepID=A0ABR5ZJT3_9GAMM|nr:ParB/RepB/Spo0J family plasmid partition protein [Pectobacterium aroidearum]MBA5739914.1 ParB/RepB/Spo0J family plasmid partition protein [Pectobacterium aroidearum]
MKRAPVMKNAPKINLDAAATGTAPQDSRQPAAPAVAKLSERVRGMTGNTITLPVCGRDVTFTLKTIPAEMVKRATMVWTGNERDQELLTAEALSDLLPSFKSTGQQNPAFGREVSGIIEVADGSRRRMAAILTNSDYRVLVGDLDPEQIAWLSQIGNEYRPTSAYERGKRYARRLKNEFDGNVSKLADAENISRKIITRCMATAELPREVVALFSSPNELSARAGEQLAKQFRDNADTLEMVVDSVKKRKGELETEEILDLLMTCCRAPRPEKTQRSFGTGIRATYKNGTVAITLKDAPKALLNQIEELLEQHKKHQETVASQTVNDSLNELERVVAIIREAAKLESYDLQDNELQSMIPVGRSILSKLKDDSDVLQAVRDELTERYLSAL